MRPDVDHCYETIKNALPDTIVNSAQICLDLLYEEVKRLQGVVDSLVREQDEQLASKRHSPHGDII